MELTKDFREFVALLNAHGVKYVLVGGYAVAWHGHPRFTKDIDFFVERSVENARAIVTVLGEFGMGSLGISASDLCEENTGVFFGRPPFRVDIINFADGIGFEEAWATRELAEWDGLPINVLSRDLLIRNKRAAARASDLVDVVTLEKRPPKSK
jgi:Nucleotidyl transferase AbiEii toxin, Type IV TA system